MPTATRASSGSRWWQGWSERPSVIYAAGPLGGVHHKAEQLYHAGMSEPDFQPTLTGPTVIVRPVAAGDWAELFAAGSDPGIWKGDPRSDPSTTPPYRE